MAASREHILKTLKEAYGYLRDGQGEDCAAEFRRLLYTPDSRLESELTSFKERLSLENPSRLELKERGQQLEKIALLIFKGLVLKPTEIKSYQSAGAQIDIYAQGLGENWTATLAAMAVPSQRMGVLVEAKATTGKVEEHQFSRLCSLSHFSFSNSVGVGVFLSVKGATGFPDRRGAKKRAVSDSRLRQLVFAARTGTPIVVFDLVDLMQLAQPGSFIELVRRKVLEIEEQTGLPTAPLDSTDPLVPDHLRDLLTEHESKTPSKSSRSRPSSA